MSEMLPFSLEEIVKDIGEKILKRKSTNSVLSFDDVLNNIIDWLAEENGENDEIGDNLDEVYGEEEEIGSNASEKCLEAEEQPEKPEDNVNRQKNIRDKKTTHTQSKRSRY